MQPAETLTRALADINATRTTVRPRACAAPQESAAWSDANALLSR